jgi:hypothetical protein
MDHVIVAACMPVVAFCLHLSLLPLALPKPNNDNDNDNVTPREIRKSQTYCHASSCSGPTPQQWQGGVGFLGRRRRQVSD